MLLLLYMAIQKPTHPPLPQYLQGILWSVDIKQLDLQKDQTYIINQILSLGTLKELRWLFHNYPTKTIRNTFLNHPIKDYADSRYHFVKSYLLGLKNQSLNHLRYVKNTPRDLR